MHRGGSRIRRGHQAPFLLGKENYLIRSNVLLKHFQHCPSGRQPGAASSLGLSTPRSYTMEFLVQFDGIPIHSDDKDDGAMVTAVQDPDPVDGCQPQENKKDTPPPAPSACVRGGLPTQAPPSGPHRPQVPGVVKPGSHACGPAYGPDGTSPAQAPPAGTVSYFVMPICTPYFADPLRFCSSS